LHDDGEGSFVSNDAVNLKIEQNSAKEEIDNNIEVLTTIYEQSWETARYFWELNWKIVSVTAVILTIFFGASEWINSNDQILSMVAAIDVYLIICLITLYRNIRRIQRKLNVITKLEQLMGLYNLKVGKEMLLPDVYLQAGKKLSDFHWYEFFFHIIFLLFITYFGLWKAFDCF